MDGGALLWREFAIGGFGARDDGGGFALVFAVDIDVGAAVGALELCVEMGFFQH